MFIAFFTTAVLNRSKIKMPASEFTWNNTSTPIFQVCGTKRKASDVDQTWQQNPQVQMTQVQR